MYFYMKSSEARELLTFRADHTDISGGMACFTVKLLQIQSIIVLCFEGKI